MIKYLFYYLAYTLVLYGVSVLLGLHTEFLHPYFYGLLAFFFLQSAFVAFLHYRAAREPGSLPIYFLGGTAFRMLTMVLLLLGFYLFKAPEMRLLVINSTVLYLLYLTFEIILLLVNLRQNSEEKR